MKLSRAILIWLLITCTAEVVCAQLVTDTIRYAQSILSMEKKRIVVEHMQLTEAEKAAFWPVYDSYCNTIDYMEMQSHQILLEFAQRIGTLRTVEIERFSKRILQNDLALARARKVYYRKFKRAITPRKAIEFMQLDNSLRMMLRNHVLQDGGRSVVMSTRDEDTRSY